MCVGHAHEVLSFALFAGHKLIGEEMGEVFPEWTENEYSTEDVLKEVTW